MYICFAINAPAAPFSPSCSFPESASYKTFPQQQRERDAVCMRHFFWSAAVRVHRRADVGRIFHSQVQSKITSPPLFWRIFPLGVNYWGFSGTWREKAVPAKSLRCHNFVRPQSAHKLWGSKEWAALSYTLVKSRLGTDSKTPPLFTRSFLAG